ncbi:chemotaxis protein CheD [Candidatus Omnitrophota bacterium]
MKRFINVHTGEVMAGKDEIVLHSDTHAACMVIVAYDPNAKIGGLAHAMFTPHNGNTRKYKHMRDADHAIDEMVNDMSALGATKDNIEVCLVTGENVPREETDAEYQENLKEVLGVLKKKSIRCREETTKDIGRLHVTFDIETGDIVYN